MKITNALLPLFWLCILLLSGWSAAVAQQITFDVTDTVRNWEPEKDNALSLTVQLPRGQVAAGDVVVFQLRATNWPGYCMNGYFGALTAPQNGAFDMSFIQQNQTATTSVTWETSAGDPHAKVQTLFARLSQQGPLPRSLSLRMECYDYGAVAKLHAVVYKRLITNRSSAGTPYLQAARTQMG